MAQSVLAAHIDEVIHEQSAEADAAEYGVDHPLDAADQAERTAFAAMQRRIGDDAVAVERQKRKGAYVIDVPSPFLDERTVFDRIPREAAVCDRQALKELVERVDVALVEWA